MFSLALTAPVLSIKTFQLTGVQLAPTPSRSSDQSALPLKSDASISGLCVLPFYLIFTERFPRRTPWQVLQAPAAAAAGRHAGLSQLLRTRQLTGTAAAKAGLPATAF